MLGRMLYVIGITRGEDVKPSDCRACEKRFMRDRLLQIELKHHAIVYGGDSAESELNERYESYHSSGHRE